MTLAELSVGQTFEGPVLIRSLEEKKTNGGNKDWLDVMIGDRSSTIKGRRFDLPSEHLGKFKVGQAVWVIGVKEEYQSKPYLNIKYFDIDNEKLANVKLTDILICAPETPKVLNEKIVDHIQSLQEDEEIHKVVFESYALMGEKFVKAPAAKAMHHAYYGGLAYHTLRMLEIAEFVCNQRPFLNKTMLKGAIILHDMMKTEEMVTDQFGVVSDYSFKGKLVGHIVMSVELVNKICVSFGIDPESEKMVLFKHALLAHHNLGEWGSPVQPQTPEAVAIHYIDQLDAKLQMVEDAVNGTSEEWTEPVFALEKKQIYTGKKK